MKRFGLQNGERAGVRTLGTLVLSVVVATSAGCSALGFIGALEETRRRNSTRPMEAEYQGLAGKSFAVVVSADRFIQGQYPEVVSHMTMQISERLAQHAQASGWVPGQTILQYQYEHPGWGAMSFGELAQVFGVERLVVVELHEYRLHEPGNQYLWSGAASGTLSIVEADSAFPDDVVFERDVRVTFLDGKAFGPSEVSQSVVATEVARRFIERTAWTLHDHEEPYYPEY